MELCTGDSLYEVINSPENAYGLSEAEFKQLISDVGKTETNVSASSDQRRVTAWSCAI